MEIGNQFEGSYKKGDESDGGRPVSRSNSKEKVGVEEADIGFKDISSSNTPNIYVGKRNFIHQLMDVALMMANVSQLKALLVSDRGDYFFLLLTFICLSISLQVIFTICMLVIWSIERKLEETTTETATTSTTTIAHVPHTLSATEERHKVIADRLDKVGNVLVLFIIVSNVFVTGFGVEGSHTGNIDSQAGGATQNMYGTVANGTLLTQ
ncbi:ninjurin-1-like [Mya arenaria]|uniref:ninjurin-1-like n=1 Tax=Mya arenaria TaxID=6604 RepID=UPI0022E458BF|nr:ninjurin-1-like [Mya arenaria]